MKNILALILISFIGFSSVAQEKILLVNGFLHIGNGETLQSALIGIENGKITLIKNSLAYTIDKSEWDTIIQLQGKHIYPGFVAPNSTLGITEIDAVRATRDFNEVGALNPHVRSQIAYNAESKVISTVKTNGVLITQATPRGGIISGTSSVMALEGWNWEDATLLKDDGIHLNWPESIDKGHSWEANSKIEKSKTYEEHKREIYAFFEMAKAYSNTEKNKKKDARFEAMRQCFKGKQRVYIHANEIQQLVDIIDFSKAFDLPFPVIVGGYDAYLVPRKLADAKISVMLTRTHSLPENENDAPNLPYQLPFLLKQGGVKFCIQNEGEMEAMNARNIPFLAGTAMAYG
ncbi:MAG: amidohydrolase, partial [Crocinitomicaceae bacterium]